LRRSESMSDSTKTKVCIYCHEALALEKFCNNIRSKDGKHWMCKPCAVQKVREWGERNPRKKKDGARRWWLRTLYGITPEKYDELLASQAGLCAICGGPGRTTQRSQRFPLQVDHDHETGRIRGLLCHRCNTILGNAGDDP